MGLRHLCPGSKALETSRYTVYAANLISASAPDFYRVNNGSTRVLVTGATGWIGRHVCRTLRERGCRVAALVPVASVEGPWDELYVGRLRHLAEPSDQLLSRLKGTRVVVHCAGRAHRPIETPDEVALFEETNVEGTRVLLSSCRQAEVARVVYVSTIAGYDWDTAPETGALESGECNPTTAYARTKIEGERLARESGLDWRVVRLATVFGQGDCANFGRLAGALRHGRFVVPGDGTARKSVIPVDLAAEVLASMALLDEPRHRLLNAAIPQIPTLREICDAFSTECGFPRARSFPLSLLRLGGMAGNVVVKLQPNFPVTSANLRKLTTSTVVDAARLYATLPDIQWPTLAGALRSAASHYRTI